MKSGSLCCRICCCAGRTACSAGMICAGSSTVFVMRLGRVASGVICLMSTARGGRCTSRCGNGWMRGCSRFWWPMCSRSYTVVCIDSRTLQSIPESGARAGYDGAKRRKGSKVHIAADTLGHLLALKVTATDRGDREQVAALAAQVQESTGSTVELAYVDQGYTGPNAAKAAEEHGIRLEVIKHPMAKRGFVLLPHRWVVERSFAWAARFRRLARDYERLETSLKGFHYIAFAILMTNKLIKAALTSC